MQNEYSASTLTVNLPAIAENYAILKERAEGSEVAAVVKANAYGLGISKVSLKLYEEGCKSFFVATLDEGIFLREMLPEVFVGVFNGIEDGQESVFYEHSLSPVLNFRGQVKIWSQYSENKEEKLPCCLHVDTGMNRLGMPGSEVGDLLKDDLLSKLDLRYLISHLACGDVHESKKNKQQLDAVMRVKEAFPNLKVSLSNSYGIFLGDEYHFNMVRPGIALYGGNPLPGEKNPMKPVVKLASRILQIRVIDTPQTVGYGATYELPSGLKIAVLSVGYADGYFRCLGNKSYCAIGGEKVPVVGQVSMDLITVDITSIEDEVKVGDEVEIIGDTITIGDLADWAGTIDYEVLTSLGDRYKRIYIK